MKKVLVFVLVVSVLVGNTLSALGETNAGGGVHFSDFPSPAKELIFIDVIQSWAQAQDQSPSVLTPDEVSAVLEQFGFNLDQVDTITGNRFTADDVRRGRVTKSVLDGYVDQLDVLAQNYERDINSYMEQADIEDVEAIDVYAWYFQQWRGIPLPTEEPAKPTTSPEELLHIGDAAKEMADRYQKNAERVLYFTEKYNDPNVKCYIVEKGKPLIALLNIPSGWYEIRHMGDQEATVQISTGRVYASGSYPLASFTWSDDDGTLYDIQKYPLCPGFEISLTECGKGESEWVLLVLTEEIPYK